MRAPAGGWGALWATARAVREQSVVLKGSKALLSMNQPDGFDCPGCAWPDPKHTSSFEFCENGAKAVTWEATKRKVTPEFFAAHTVSELARRRAITSSRTRAVSPIRWATTARPTAMSRSAGTRPSPGSARCCARSSPDRAEFYTSGRASNEAAFLFQMFVARFGTNNFPDCSNMCHEATSVGLPETIGIGKGTVSLEDFDHSDAIFVIGHNPGTNNPRMMTRAARGVAARRADRRVQPAARARAGALRRSAGPDRDGDVQLDPDRLEYLQVQVGGDVAALKGVMKAVLDARRRGVRAGPVLDLAFIDAAHGRLRSAAPTICVARRWDDIVRVSGSAAGQLERVARIYMQRQVRHRLLRHGHHPARHGTENVQQIANLLLMRGNFGKPGAGICPVRGHSNVQGDRTVGIDEKPKRGIARQHREGVRFRAAERTWP